MSEFQRLHSITDAMYLRAQQSLRVILLREATLRGELSKLDSNARANRKEQTIAIESMRAIGADLLWEGWVSKTRAQLNLELAQVLAQKEQNIGHVRKAFGKKIVSEKLLQRDTGTKAKTARGKALDQAIEQSLRP
jgi:hypothetical protein